MNKENLKWDVVFIILFIIIAPFLISPSLGGETRIKNHAHHYYQSLMKGQNSDDPEKLIQEAKKKSSPIYLIVYKRSCTRCQADKYLVREKVKSYKKAGATVLVAEAPEKGDVSSYPSWIKQFSLPQAKTPVIIRYDVSPSSASEALPYTSFQEDF